MTRKEFLECAAKESHFSNDQISQHYVDKIRENFGVNSNFVLDFLCSNGFNGNLVFAKDEKNGIDWLLFRIEAFSAKVCYWEDIGQYVSPVASISIYNYKAEVFYLSQDGHFWDKNHRLRFQTEEELFDYFILNEHFVFPPFITEKTYEMLRHFGWYEGRRIDTTEFEKELKKRGIILSQIQLDTIREFSGLKFSFSKRSNNNEFYSSDEMIERINSDDLDFESEVYDKNQILIGKNVLEIGSTDVPNLSVSDEGRIFFDGTYIVSRNALEYIYSFCEDLPENVVWL